MHRTEVPPTTPASRPNSSSTITQYFSNFAGQSTHSPRWRAPITLRTSPTLWRVVKAVVINSIALFPIGAVDNQLLEREEWKLLSGPLVASCFLIFGHPQSVLAQPLNVVLGHAIGAIVGMCIGMIGGWVSVVFAVPITMMILEALRLGHPPACGTTLVAATRENLMVHMGGWFMMATVLSASWLVLVSCVFNNLAGHQYPRHWWMF
eukprot:c16000_g1_i1.p1 GENE.c16000_g1_i1~~c16000_g1_i1.p1  ORF type:complete len:207 (-),score=50.74 c16000_g1_i1:62-682(-)